MKYSSENISKLQALKKNWDPKVREEASDNLAYWELVEEDAMEAAFKDAMEEASQSKEEASQS